MTSPRGTSSFAVGKLNVVAAVFILLAFCALYVTGFLEYGFAFVLLGLPVVMVATRLWRALRGGLEYGLLRQPLRRELRTHLLQALNRWTFLILAAGMILSAAFAHYSVGLSERGYLFLQIALWAGIVVMAVLAIVPRRRVYLATNVLVALGTLFLAIQVVRVNVPPRGGVVIDFPLNGEWFVFHGGRSELVASAHYALKAQRDAIDIVKLEGRRTYSGDKDRLTSYAAFGETAVAPADGRVTSAEDRVRDQPVGEINSVQPLGNHVVIGIGGGHYVLMAHLKRGSLRVSNGDRVRRGQPIAEVGNSGQSSEPHLHLQIQNEPTFDIEQSSFDKPWYVVTNTVIGAGSTRTYPILFRNVVLTRGGEERRPIETWVRRGDRIRRMG